MDPGQGLTSPSQLQESLTAYVHHLGETRTTSTVLFSFALNFKAAVWQQKKNVFENG